MSISNGRCDLFGFIGINSLFQSALRLQWFMYKIHSPSSKTLSPIQPSSRAISHHLHHIIIIIYITSQREAVWVEILFNQRTGTKKMTFIFSLFFLCIHTWHQFCEGQENPHNSIIGWTKGTKKLLLCSIAKIELVYAPGVWNVLYWVILLPEDFLNSLLSVMLDSAFWVLGSVFPFWLHMLHVCCWVAFSACLFS